MNVAIVFTVIGQLGADLAVAQTPEENDAEFIEVQQARDEMDAARRDLERAARSIGVYRLNDDAFVNVQVGDAPFIFLGQGSIGMTIVDADDGALVTRVAPDSSAEKAGLRVGDVVRSIDGFDVATGDDGPSQAVTARLRESESGDLVSIAVERAGDFVDLEFEVPEGAPWLGSVMGMTGNLVRNFSQSPVPAPVALSRDSLQAVTGPNAIILRTLGLASSPWSDMELISMSEGLGRYFDTTEGLLVVRAPEDEAIDIQDGDVIIAIGGRSPNSPEHAIRILSSFEPGETIEFSLMRDGRSESVQYAIPETGVRRQTVPAQPD